MNAQHRTMPTPNISKKTKKEIFDLYEKYNLGIANDPGNAQAFFERGWLRYSLHDTLNAITDLEKAISLNPKNAFYHYGYAYVIIDRKEYDAVVRACDEALKYDKTFVDVLVMRGSALDQLKKPQEARENYDKALQIDSTYEDTYLQYASSYALTNNLDEVEKLIVILLRRLPHSEDGLKYKAKFYMHKKQYKEAIAAADALLKSKKGLTDMLLLKAAAYDSLRNRPKVCECMYELTLQGYIDGYEYIMEKCPKEQEYKPIKINTLQLKGVEMEDLGKYEESMKIFNEIIQLMPDSGNHYYNRGKLKRKMENHVGAIEDYKIAIKKSPSFSPSYVAAGVSYTLLGDFENAKAYYLKCMKVDPFNEMAYYNYADILTKNDDNYKEAIFYYKYAIDIKPDYVKAHYWLGEAYAKLGMHAEACESFKIAERLGEVKAISQRIWHCNQ
jgi:tetratricopeptide (TPR) repeat protein